MWNQVVNSWKKTKASGWLSGVAVLVGMLVFAPLLYLGQQIDAHIDHRPYLTSQYSTMGDAPVTVWQNYGARQHGSAAIRAGYGDRIADYISCRVPSGTRISIIGHDGSSYDVMVDAGQPQGGCVGNVDAQRIHSD
jgi:hypothetical protein